MLKTLVKKQLMEIFRSYFYNAKTNKKRSTAGIIAYILLFAALMIGGIGGMFTGLSVSLCAPLTQAGMGWLYFALMSLLAIFLGAFGSVFNTYSGLYFAKDNDLLLSLPIPVRTLMASRLLTVYLMGLMYSAVVILPAVIVYWVTVSAAPMALLGGVLLTALISIFVLTLSCALGWVVAKVSRKLKHKSFITVIVSLAGLAIYYFFVFKAQTAIEQLVANAAVYGEKIKGAAHPLYIFGLTGRAHRARLCTAKRPSSAGASMGHFSARSSRASPRARTTCSTAASVSCCCRSRASCFCGRAERSCRC